MYRTCYGTADGLELRAMEQSVFPGGGPPARSLALLWRTSERASRKGKPDLGVELIVRTAIELADTAGLAPLSTRRVAARPGVGPMSLHPYVPGRAELLDVMLDTVYGEAAATAEPTEPTWRARLEH